MAPAKINLCLHVTGRRPDGYHLLDSLVAFADIGDLVTVRPGEGFAASGPFAKGMPLDDRNLAVRAARMAGGGGRVTLDKRLPHPGGIGGGSSDAAAVLRLLGADPSVDQLLTLGADLPVCMAGRAARMSGIGDRVEQVGLPLLHGVLIHPGLSVPTPACFAALESRDNLPMGPIPAFSSAEDAIDWLRGCRNDLETAAARIAPGIDAVLASLRAAGARLARMSGSGATCFGLWSTRAEAEIAARSLDRVDWWVRAVSLA